MKQIRQKVYSKYGGRCAYCGEIITLKAMQVDHIMPKYDGGADTFDNFNPTCRKCNNFKTSFSLEQFRYELSMQVTRLKSVSQFDRALRYGQIEITQKPIVFYFETVEPVEENELKGSEG